jgi:hypothetical protein
VSEAREASASGAFGVRGTRVTRVTRLLGVALTLLFACTPTTVLPANSNKASELPTYYKARCGDVVVDSVVSAGHNGAVWRLSRGKPKWSMWTGWRGESITIVTGACVISDD